MDLTLENLIKSKKDKITAKADKKIKKIQKKRDAKIEELDDFYAKCLKVTDEEIEACNHHLEEIDNKNETFLFTIKDRDLKVVWVLTIMKFGEIDNLAENDVETYNKLAKQHDKIVYVFQELFRTLLLKEGLKIHNHIHFNNIFICKDWQVAYDNRDPFPDITQVPTEELIESPIFSEKNKR